MTEQELKELAILVIYNYYDGLYSKEYIDNNFGLAIKLILENSKLRISGASYVSENGISITYANNFSKYALTEDVLALLPKKRNYRAW